MGVEGEVDIAISKSIIDETLRVLRDKFHATQYELDTASSIMDACGRMVYPVHKLDVVKADPDDNHIVECAVTAEAAAIITGDKHLLNLQAYESIAIMKVGGFPEQGTGTLMCPPWVRPFSADDELLQK